jgi:hypothetical protein
MSHGPHAQDSDAATQQIDENLKKALCQMEENVADAEIQTKSCQSFLNDLCRVPQPENSDRAPVALELDFNKAASILIKAMKAHPSHVELQKSACLCLDMMVRLKVAGQGSCSAQSLECLEKPDAFGVIADAFVNHPDDADLLMQISACQALTVILRHYSGSCKPLKKIIASCGIFRATVTALTTHKQAAEMQKFGMDMLKLLCNTLKDAKEMLKHDAIGAVLKGMTAHKKNTVVQIAGCELLHDIVDQSAAIADDLWKHGAMGIVLGALDTYNLGSWEPELTLTISSTLNLIERSNKGGFVLKCLDFIRQMYEKASKPRPQASIGAVSSVLARHLQDANIQEYGLHALSRAMELCDQNIEILGQRDMRAVLGAISTHHENLNLVLHGLDCACRMTFRGESNRNRKLMVEDNSLSVVLRIMAAHKNSGVLQLKAIGTMACLAQGDDISVKEAMIKAGCVGAVVQAMLHYKGEDDERAEMACRGCECLKMLINAKLSSDTMALFVQQNGVDACLDVMLKWKDYHDIQADCCEAFTQGLILHTDVIKTYGQRMIRAIVRAMLAYQNDNDLQRYACFSIRKILHHFSVTDARQLVQDEFATCGGLDAIFQCTRMFSASNFEDIAVDACWAVYYAAYENHRNRVYFFEHNILMILASINARYKNKERVLTALASAGSLFIHTGTVPSSASDVHANKASGGKSPVNCAKETHDDSSCNTEQLSNSFAAHTLNRTQKQASHTMNQTQNQAAPQYDTQNQATLQQQGQSQKKPKSETNSQRPRSEQTCVACGKTPAEMGIRELLKCSACTIAPKYCSAGCQKACWGEHKTECKANRKISD